MLRPIFNPPPAPVLRANEKDRCNRPAGCNPAPLVHPAYSRISAHPASAGRRFLPRRRCSIGVGGESGILLAHAGLPAGRTIHIRSIVGAPDQLFELSIAILALILVDRHSYSVINTHILSITE